MKDQLRIMLQSLLETIKPIGQWTEKFIPLEIRQETRKLFNENLSFSKDPLDMLINMYPIHPKSLLYFAKLTFEVKELDSKSILSKYPSVSAHLVAHLYKTLYEYIKPILLQMYKAKFGKATNNSKELLTIFAGYSTLENLLQEKIQNIRANQIRNCIAHENYYFDYSDSSFVFLIHEKEVRIQSQNFVNAATNLVYLFGAFLCCLISPFSSSQTQVERRIRNTF